MSWSLLDAADGFRRHAEELDRLSDRYFEANPLLCSAFIGPLIDHFGAGGDLLCVSYRGTDPDGFLLLTKRQAGVWSVFLPAQAQVAPAVLSAGADLDRLIRALPGMALSIEMFCQDPHYSFLVPEPPAPASEVVEHVTTMNVEVAGGFDEYWQARSKNLRKSIGRYLRRLEKEGIARRLEVVERESELQEALIRYGDMESAGWKGKKGTAIHRENAQGRFYADVLKRFAESGHAYIYELYFDDRLVASRICVASESLLVILKTTYDEETAKYAPGRLLLYALLEKEFAEQRYRAIEFYTNATRDQISWATGTRSIYHMTQYRNPLVEALIAASRPVRAWLEARAKRAD